MIAGGNANAREAFGEMTLNLKDLKSKYTSKSAQSYKSKLQRKAQQLQHETQQKDASVTSDLIDFDQPQQDSRQLQHAALIDFDDGSMATTSTLKTEHVFDELDIFKPIGEPTTTTTTSVFDDLISPNNGPIPVKQCIDSKSSTCNDSVLSKETVNHSTFDDLLSPPPSSTTNLIGGDDPFDKFISSSSSPNQPPANPAVDDFFDQFESASNISTSPKSTTKKRQLKPPKSNYNKLGARKVKSDVFQQQTALALEEEKMRKQGIDEETIGRSSRNQVFAQDQSVSIPKLQKPSSRLIYQPTEQKNQDERLGMMSLSSQPSSNQKKKTPTVDAQEDHFARDKFGNAKAISSDQYFGRHEYSPQRSASNASRLSQFQGSQSISSDQYFGRKSTTNQNSTTLSKKILNVAAKSATKFQNILADMEDNMK